MSTTKWTESTMTTRVSLSSDSSSTSNDRMVASEVREKKRQMARYESSSDGERAPEDGGEEDEVDETFVALQKLLKTLNGSRPSSAQVTPVRNMGGPRGEPVQAADTAPASADHRHGSTVGGAHNVGARSSSSNRRLSQEEILEVRRGEREQFRQMLLSTARRRRPVNYNCEEEEEEDEPAPSVESAISNRVISGSFSSLNVHVISRDRWATEEVERLPIVLFPKNGKVVSPADNPKLNVCHTKEYEELQEQLMTALEKMSDDADHGQLLTPPQSTWYIQMRNLDAVQC